MNVVLADDECPTFCTAEYSPLCAGPDGNQNATEWRDFDNQCALDIHNCNNEDNGKYLPSYMAPPIMWFLWNIRLINSIT